MQRRGQRGQAAVETALTMPLTLFVVLGLIQLSLMMQARLMTEHAAAVAVRQGSLAQGYCHRMMHGALLTLLPTFTRTDSEDRLVEAFGRRSNNRYRPGLDSGHEGPIVWIDRTYDEGEGPVERQRPPGRDLSDFDDPSLPPLHINVRVIFWYPLRIPFANWVISNAALASLGVASYSGFNALSPTQTAEWKAERPGALTGEQMKVLRDVNLSGKGTYVLPLVATASMKMMTPPRSDQLSQRECR